MSTPEIVFWACVALIAYPYFLYPLLLAALSRLFGRDVKRGPCGPRTVSIVMCVHNEQANVERRLLELIDLLDATECVGEIIVVSDGSTDDTAAVVRLHSKRYVRLLELTVQVGKADALSRGVAMARHEIVVFADVRQRWAPDALERLLENFADEQVGAVSGDLVIEPTPGVLAGVGLYWRFEKWLRMQESRLWAQVGVTGAISAVRHELFRPIPPGTLLDDVYWPLGVAMQGKRVVHDHRAVAYDRLPAKTGDEMHRKVRTLAGNFQLLTRLPSALVPWRNPVWLQWLSHKLARLIVPWAMIGLLVANLFLIGSPFYRGAFVAQLLCYGLGLAGLFMMNGGRYATALGSLLVLNGAAWLAFWVWITGRARQSWRKVGYQGTGEAEPAPAAPVLPMRSLTSTSDHSK